MTIPLCIFTSDKTDWTLGGFFYQLEKYANTRDEHISDWLEPIVFGYRTPPSLPEYAQFVSLGDFADYPPNRWSDAFLMALDILESQHVQTFWFTLDDYWIIRGVDTRGVRAAYEYTARTGALKVDLAFDRLYSDVGRYAFYANNYDTTEHLDIIRSDPNTGYHMSLWGGIFNAPQLRRVIRPGWTAQEIELLGTPLLRETDMNVFGTRQAPVLHTNVCHSGRYFQFDPRLSAGDMESLRQAGHIPMEVLS